MRSTSVVTAGRRPGSRRRSASEAKPPAKGSEGPGAVGRATSEDGPEQGPGHGTPRSSRRYYSCTVNHIAGGTESTDASGTIVIRSFDYRHRMPWASRPENGSDRSTRGSTPCGALPVSVVVSASM